ncbi:MAG TPA: hypothetical protein VJM33_04970 [Microthrixaceae bacterium]|nr:hypothetical protein [Microthrixaceae bacterium]
MAEDETVMARVLALELCANLSPRANQGQPLGRMRELLLNEEWVEAVSEWMLLTGEELDVYPDEPIWTRADLSDEQASFEIRLSPIFRDQERD